MTGPERTTHLLNILLRTDGASITGMGHFYRCLSLAKQMPVHGIKPHFIMKFASEPTLSVLKSEGISCDTIPEHVSWSEEVKLLGDLLEIRPHGIVMDISHDHTMAHLGGLLDYVQSLGRLCGVVALLDGAGRDSIMRSVELDVHMLVTPYFVESVVPPRSGNRYVHLNGPEFMIYRPEFRAVIGQKRAFNEYGLNVLLTFGGTDSRGLTVKALNALSHIRDRRLRIRVVVGPGFDPELVRVVRTTCSIMDHHSCELILSPSTIANLVNWCDVAVCTSGLTKYEMAATGTPCIVLSLSEEHEKIDFEFAKAGTAACLGFHGSLSTADVKEAVAGLLDDVRMRSRMCGRGLQLFPGGGSERIIVRLLELCRGPAGQELMKAIGIQELR